jgi:hypothetical protein
MAVPYTFGSATSSIPLSQLDSNFATGITLGNTTVYLGNTTTTFGNVSLTNVTISSVSTAITPSQGGTGLVTIPANNVILGNGTSNVAVVAPGTSGNVLTSNGTTWSSSTISAASVSAAGSTTQVQYNNGGAFAGSANLTFNGTTLTAAGLAGPFNGTVGATTANTGAFTTLSASSTVSGTGFSTYLASPPAIGGTAAAAGTFTTLTTSSTITDNGGTANGVTYLNGSKVVTSGSALTFDGSTLGVGAKLQITAPSNTRYSDFNTTSAGYGFSSFSYNGTAYGYVAQASSSFIGGSNTDFAVNAVNNLIFGANNVEKMRISNATGGVGAVGIGYTSLTSVGDNGLAVLGNVGIGTSSPSYKLDVVAASSSAIPARLKGNASGNNNTQLRFAGNNSGTDLWAIGTEVSTSSTGTAFDFYDLTAGANRMRLDSAGNLGLGTTLQNGTKLNVMGGDNVPATSGSTQNGGLRVSSKTTGSGGYVLDMGVSDTNGYAWMQVSNSANLASGFVKDLVIQPNGGNLLVGATSQANNERLNVTTGNTTGMVVKTTGGATYVPIYSWNATTTGDGYFAGFFTEASATFRGSITYNRAGGLTAYNTTSDYRAKDISGPVTNSGALIDSIPVYMGTMKGATQERPMFIAHETPAYAHTGEKDAVDADGNPVYQQMDASALIPVMWAEIQSLRQRLSAANL